VEAPEEGDAAGEEASLRLPGAYLLAP